MRILLVEDEAKLANAVKKGLEQEGFAVDLALDAENGMAFAETEEYDVLVLDRMLPGGQDGLDICKKLRQNGNNTPTLMLTARDTVPDKVQGLSDGADDYLAKPFSFDELVARIHALTRRPKEVIATKLQFQNLSVDFSTKKIRKGKQEIPLSKKEFAILEYLAHKPGQIVSKDELIRHVWDFDADVLPNTVEVFIRYIRKKLGNQAIETVRGFGYKLNV